MDNISSNQLAFIRLMKSGEDFERHGFELLLKRSDFDNFFEALANEGLFDPVRNPGPVSAEKPGYYRLPYWPPLAYLEAAAKRASERADTNLSEKVMQVVRSVSQWRDDNNKPRANHNTWSTFADLLGFLPTSVVSIADIELIPAWLADSSRQSMVGDALATGVLRNFLASEESDDWAKACRLLYYCTSGEFVEEGSEAANTTTELRTLIDDDCLKQLINENAGVFGRKAGKAAADVFRSRLNEAYAHAMDGHYSWVFRPAIEDDPQNHDWRGPQNRFVEGLRDSMLAWIDSDAKAARIYVKDLLTSGSQIIERVALHLVDQRFDALRGLVPMAISSSFFDSGHRHELYLLLKSHFRQFTNEEQTATIDAVRGLSLPDKRDDALRERHVAQRTWLSAMSGQGYEAVDTWLAELNDNLGPTGSFYHPEFNSYIESGSGSGPTPHNVKELIVFARDGIIVEQLNAFAPSNAWDGPSIRSLSDAVIEAVGMEPHAFVDQLPNFLQAKPEYQYAIIAGFKKRWDIWDGEQEELAWNQMWPKLIDFFETLLTGDYLWKEEITGELPLPPTGNWIPPIISEFLRAGIRNDDKAFAPDLLPRMLPLVTILLDRSESQKDPAASDALNVAINTAKGKAVEALLDYTLHCCRLSDNAAKTHAETWQQVQPLFDKELAACQNRNFEFSALAGAYISNLLYMSGPWVDANFKKIFPVEFPINCLTALDGLAFSARSKPVYTALVASGVLDWALRHEMKGKRARESLLERMGLAYLWEDETLDGPRFSYLFETRRINDLEDLSNYFWMIRREALDEKKKEQILRFWDRCVTWAKSLESAPANLLSLLSLLSCYLDVIDERALAWLLAVAPHTPVNYNANRLVEQLVRLASDTPREAGKILRVLLEGYHPTYDFKDQIKQLITQLANHPESRDDAIVCLEQVHYLSGMVQMYSQLFLSCGVSSEQD